MELEERPGEDGIRAAVEAAVEMDFPDEADSGPDDSAEGPDGAAGGGGDIKWTPDDPLDLRLSRLPRNDLGNADRMLRRWGEGLVYVMNRGWYAWDGQRWSQPHGEYVAKERAHATARAIAREAQCLRDRFGSLRDDKEAREEAIRLGIVHRTWVGERKELQKAVWQEAGALERWSVQSGNSARTTGMLAQAQPMRRRDIADLDARPLLLNCRNGTLELHRQGPNGPWVRLREHDPLDLLTKAVPADFDAALLGLMEDGEGGTEWEAALADILPDREERAFLARWFGYCIAGPPDEQAMLVMSGEGSNGKSVIVETIEHVLGDYRLRLPIHSLMQDDSRRGSEARPDLVELPGVRLAVTVEPEGGAKLSSNMIKELTERDIMRVRQLNSPFISFPPQHRLVMMCNEKPVVRGTDKGTWRRLKNLAFRQRFVKPEDLADNPGAKVIDFDLGKRLKARPEVVLAWLVAGWLAYAAHGLAEPESVRLETEAYRLDNDPVGQFLKACTAPSKGWWVTGADLYAAYKDWCAKSGQDAWSMTAFGRIVSTKLKKRVSGVTQYLDIELVSPP